MDGLDIVLALLARYSGEWHGSGRGVMQYGSGFIGSMVRGRERHQTKLVHSTLQTMVHCVLAGNANMLTFLGTLLPKISLDHPELRRLCKEADMVPLLTAILEPEDIAGGNLPQLVEGPLLALLGSLTHGSTEPPPCSEALLSRASSEFLRHKAMASSVRQHVQRDNGKPQLAADSASGARPYGVFPIGVSVLVSGLQAKPELNGLVGQTMAYDGASERYVVKLENGMSVKLKTANLSVANEAEVEALLHGVAGP
jgi:hypothetical protein